MSNKKIRLPSVPKDASRDMTVFLQTLKQVIETIGSNSSAVSGASRSYILRTNNSTYDKLNDKIDNSLAVGNILDILNGSITESQLFKDLGSRIAKIETNEINISTETQDRIAELLLTNNNLSSEITHRKSDIEDMTGRVDIVLANTNDNTTLIATETNTRTTEISAHTSQLTLLETKTANAGTRIGTLETTTANQTQAIANTKTELRTEFQAADDINTAAIGIERTARTTAVSSVASSVDTLQTTVGNNTASVQTAQDSIDGINASWSIKTDVNGVVGGLGVVNDGRTADFMVRGSSFVITGPSGSNSTPFVSYPEDVTINGVLIKKGNYLDAAFIRKASIDKLSSLSADIGTLTTSDSRGTFTYTGSKIELRDVNGNLLMEMGLL